MASRRIFSVSGLVDLPCHSSISRLSPSSLPLSPARFLSTTPPALSKIGQRLLTFPPDVSIAVTGGPEVVQPAHQSDSTSKQKYSKHAPASYGPQRDLVVKGPRGELSIPIPPYLSITTLPIEGSTSRRLSLTVTDPKDRSQRTMWGTTNALANNMLTGVTEGFSVTLRLVGVGYRASLVTNPRSGKPAVDLKLGYSHPIVLDIPEGVAVDVIAPQRVRLRGTDRQRVTQFAASMRKWKPPEPYNQKGIFVGDETIAKKEGKKK